MGAKRSDIHRRQAEFLTDCLDRVEPDLETKDPNKYKFFLNCLTRIGETNELLRDELIDLHPVSEDDKKDPKTYDTWLQSLANTVQTNIPSLRGKLSDYDLYKFPLLQRTQGVKGNATRFYISPIKTLESEGFTNDAVENQPTPDYDQLIYQTQEIAQPPLHLRWVKPLFQTKRTRMMVVAAIYLGVFFALPLSLLYLTFNLNSLTSALAWSVLLLTAVVAWRPAHEISRLITRKITMIESVRAAPNSVCISQIFKVDSDDPTDTERHLSALIVSADCPICKHQYGLRNSIKLESHGVVGGQIVGACLNNPTAHRYSFDKDLMTGKRL